MGESDGDDIPHMPNLIEGEMTHTHNCPGCGKEYEVPNKYEYQLEATREYINEVALVLPKKAVAIVNAMHGTMIDHYEDGTFLIKKRSIRGKRYYTIAQMFKFV